MLKQFLRYILKKFHKPSKNQLFASFKVLKDEQVVIEVMRGTITLSGIKKLKLEQVADPDFNPNFNQISDLRDCKIVGLISEMDDFVDFMKAHGDKIAGNRKVVGLVNSPLLVGYLKFYRNKQVKLRQEFRLFASLSDGLEWIERKELFDKINSEISVLEQQLKQH